VGRERPFVRQQLWQATGGSTASSRVPADERRMVAALARAGALTSADSIPITATSLPDMREDLKRVVQAYRRSKQPRAKPG
jgi:hypothetical protein